MSPERPSRLDFVRTSGAFAAGVAAVAPAAGNAGVKPSGDIPRRPFGRHPDRISAIGVGGHHLGDMASATDATALVHEAIDAGINFFDNAWEYNNHQSEAFLGAALRGGYRDKIFLMTKVCTHGRDASLAMEMLEQSLRRLGTDRLDLWQIHAITYENDPELAYRHEGVLEAFDLAKRQGKVRYVGFTGHKSPLLHARMLELGYPFDSVQLPLNPFDGQFRSFETGVVPEARKRGVAVLGMKAFGGDGGPFHRGDVQLQPDRALRYAMSVPGVTTTICGMETRDLLRANVAVARSFVPMTDEEMAATRSAVAPVAGDGRYEIYKTSIAYDNIVTRAVHGMPIEGAHP